jgi:hypothetical protein
MFETSATLERQEVDIVLLVAASSGRDRVSV